MNEGPLVLTIDIDTTNTDAIRAQLVLIESELDVKEPIRELNLCFNQPISPQIESILIPFLNRMSKDYKQYIKSIKLELKYPSGIDHILRTVRDEFQPCEFAIKGNLNRPALSKLFRLIQKSKHLQSVTLEGISLNETDLKSLLSKLSKRKEPIKKLSLIGNKISLDNARFIVGHFPIEALDLSYNSVHASIESEDKFKDFCTVATRRLTGLTLCDYDFTPSNVRVLSTVLEKAERPFHLKFCIRNPAVVDHLNSLYLLQFKNSKVVIELEDVLEHMSNTHMGRLLLQHINNENMIHDKIEVGDLKEAEVKSAIELLLTNQKAVRALSFTDSHLSLEQIAILIARLKIQDLDITNCPFIQTSAPKEILSFCAALKQLKKLTFRALDFYENDLVAIAETCANLNHPLQLNCSLEGITDLKVLELLHFSLLRNCYMTVFIVDPAEVAKGNPLIDEITKISKLNQMPSLSRMCLTAVPPTQENLSYLAQIRELFEALPPVNILHYLQIKQLHDKSTAARNKLNRVVLNGPEEIKRYEEQFNDVASLEMDKLMEIWDKFKM